MASKSLHLENFIMGMRRDGALTQEQARDEEAGKTPYILHSLKTMENYDIDYVDGSISPRDGYSRYHTEVVPTTNGGLEQIFYNTDLERIREDVFVISNDRWYRITLAAAHSMIIDEDVTIEDGYKKPIIVWGNRVFFATDSGWYWTDKNWITAPTKYYQAGIDKPDGSLSMYGISAVGQTDYTTNRYIQLNTMSKRKIAFQVTPERKIMGNSIKLYLQRFATTADIYGGSIRVKIYTDNSGEPSTTLAHENAVSDWLSSNIVPHGAFDYRTLYFSKAIELAQGTKVWVVLEGDDAYYDRFADSISATYYIGIGCHYQTPFEYGQSMVYDTSGSPDIWDTVNDYECVFYFSGPEVGTIYEYVCTYYNSTYGVESRPSDKFRITIETATPIPFMSDYPDTTDGQVDKVRIYRRALDAGMTIDSTDDATTIYELVEEIPYGNQFWDGYNDDYLGAELQTTDHYRIGEADDTSNNYRTAIIPACACIWKGRIWVVPKNSNVLYFSKKLEEDGATGITGDPIPDYFPLTNKIEVGEEAAILAIKPLANDQMAIYFRNGPVYVLWGMDEVLNPPSDYSLRPMVYNIGLTSSWALCDFRSQHIYLSRQGLYSFSGNQRPEYYMSEGIQSILDGISDANLAKSVLVARGEELWLLLDDDADGYKETIYILNLQKQLSSWRRYNYGVHIGDLCVKALSSASKDILATDSTNAYVMELETGTTDNGKPISSYIESHVNKVRNAFIHKIEVNALYSAGNVPAFFDFTLSDHVGNEATYQLNPKNSMDLRGHSIGTRMKTYGSFGVKMEQSSVKKTDVLAVTISYEEEK